MGMWMNLDKPMFKDINVRLGVAHAMNIDKVISTVLRGDYLRAQNCDIGYGEFTNKTIKAREFDLKKAEEYFKKAGWEKRGSDGILTKDGQRLSMTVTYGVSHHQDRLVVLKEEAKKAGLELNLNLMDSATAFKAILEKQHEIAYMAWGSGWRPQYWESVHSANAHKPQTNNIANYVDPEMDKMVDKYEGELDEKVKIKLAHQIQQKIFDAAFYIPTFLTPYFRQAYWRYWRLPKVPGTKSSDIGFNPFSQSIGGLFWFDQKLKDETDKAVKKNQKFPASTVVDKTYKI